MKLTPFNWERHKLEVEKQQIEKAMQRKLLRKVRDAGYRALAKKLHPDAGGSVEDMARLIRARDETTRILGLKMPRHRARHIWTFEWKGLEDA